MIDGNSNCARLDAVKARAAQLRMQLDQMPRRTPEDSNQKKAQNQVDSLENAVKKGKADTAETALSSAAAVMQEVHSESTANRSLRRGLDVFA